MVQDITQGIGKPDTNGQPEGNPPELASRILTRSQLFSLPDPEPLIDNVLDQGTFALLYGKWGSAKTFIALDWGASVATGRNWQGRATEKRRVLYIAGEGAYGIKGRIDAWETGWRNTIGEDGFVVLPFAVNLMSTQVNELLALISWGGFGFVIVDTLARSMVGGDENSARDGGIIVDAITRMVAATPGGRGVVLGVHHAGKDGKTLRGTTAFESGADVVYFTKKDGNRFTLTREKRKDGPPNDQHELRLDLIPGTDSAVMSAWRRTSADADTGADRLLAFFTAHFDAAEGASKPELRKLAEDAGMSTTTFYRAIKTLTERGDLVNVGTTKRPHYKGGNSA